MFNIKRHYQTSEINTSKVMKQSIRNIECVKVKNKNLNDNDRRTTQA